MANWGAWQSSASSSSWGIETSGKAMTGPKEHGNQHNLTRIGRPQRPVHQLCLHRLLPITSIMTKRPSVKGAHVLHKKVQPTEWSVNRD